MSSDSRRNRGQERMNCRSFAEKIMSADPGDPQTFKDAGLREHLLVCRECQNLMQAFWSRASEDFDPGLTQDILARTSGGSCRQATELLCDFVDGDLAENQARLVENHVAHCRECSRLVRTLAEMQRSLPGLSELSPPLGFAERVARSLPDWRRGRQGWRGRVQAWFASLPQRPLITVEAAYLGTLLLFLLFGNPFASLPESRRLLAGFAEQSGLAHVAKTGYQGAESYVRDSFEAVHLAAARLDASGQDLEELRADLSKTVDTYYGRGQSTVRSVAHFFGEKGSTLKKKLQAESAKE